MSSDRNLEDTFVKRNDCAGVDADRAILNPIPADLSGFIASDETDSNTDSQAGAFIGRYQIIRKLGKGGFGIVFLARDSDLDRLVAIKLPHVHRMLNDGYRQMYLMEARTLARLDHPAIVPIFDCGVIADGRCFVVSKYIEGRDLAHELSQRAISTIEIVRLVADVAEALHHVHQARVIHRDVKPANLLLGLDGRVYVADFGLALRDDPVLNAKETFAGTPNYMSPEQVRGEGHRVDGRSDQFSLGVVMYEMLTRERPFSGGSSHDVLYRILSQDPIPPRQLNRSVPAELNRICLKLLSKLASQRDDETIDLANDLREWIRKAEGTSSNIEGLAVSNPSYKPYGPGTVTTGSNATVTVIPRGLRAFTRADAYFFPELLPGTRDRDGLPTSLSHWRRWVSIRDDAPELQRVGVISGPTGCGKSSLIRAGLVPLLGSDVISVVLEATPDLTERQLLAAIERHCPEHLAGSLPDSLAAIRRGGGFSSHKSLLIVIDQFEQWLHAHPEPLDSELVRAIRQCDGIRIQCILLIRDDFWLALSRFMEAVESPLQIGGNAMMVDLFDRRHAKKVLIEFGRGYNRLAAAPEPIDRDQERFIDGAIDSLLTDGKVVPIHLALFAEMVKSKDWTPATLRTLGGTVGIGAQFLHESLSATYAPVNQRTHDEAARSILQALVPGLGTEIKANHKTRAELLALSGYDNERSRFDMLMTILESDLKLISATESLDRTRSQSNPSSNEQTTYQLSHDFLVPSIREWLTARLRASFRGRLHQRLTEQASLWTQQKEARFLPNLWEWLQARVFLSRKQLTATESSMLSVADRRSIKLLSAAIVAMIVIAFGLHRYQVHTRVSSLVEQLQTADSDQILTIADGLFGHGSLAQSTIESAISRAPENSSAKFALQLAQLKWSGEPAEDVLAHVMSAPAIDSALIAGSALLPFAAEISPKCWRMIEAPASASPSDAASPSNAANSDAARFRAVLLLASLDPPLEPESKHKWESSAQSISELLIQACSSHPDEYSAISHAMQAASPVLIPSLSLNLGAASNDLNTAFAISLLADFSNQDPDLRTRLCLDASDWQKATIVPERDKLSASALWHVVREPIVPPDSEDVQNRLARRRAMATALILTLPDQSVSEDAWLQLKRSSENVQNTARSALIRLIAERGVPLERLITRLRIETDPGIQYALILAIGDYATASSLVTSDVRIILKSLYQTAPDAGVHSAAEWLLKRWGERDAIADLPVESAASARSGPAQPRQWMRSPRLVTCDGHTMIRVDARSNPKIGREFLMAAHEVTVQQVADFNPQQYPNRDYSRTPDSPMSVVEWRMAVAYCNWLSKREGLPEFYPDNDEDAEKWVVTEDALKQPGYRLPMEAEWEFASLSGSQSERFFGTESDMVVRYAWCVENSEETVQGVDPPQIEPRTKEPAIYARPVGLLRPNDFGLFDIYGNVSEWCNDLGRTESNERGIRGGAVGGMSRYMNSGKVGSALPRQQYNSNGFRITRTLESH